MPSHPLLSPELVRSDAPPQPQVPAARPQTAAPERTEEPFIAAPTAEAAPEPSREEGGPDPVLTDGERLLAAAEAAVSWVRLESRSEVRPESSAEERPTEERDDSLQARALGRATAA